MFTNVHPTETAGTGFSHSETDQDTKRNFFLYNCPHCGFRNRLDRDNPANQEGEGISYVSRSIDVYKENTKIVDRTVTRKEPVRVSGCRLCGHDYTQSTYRRPEFSLTINQGR